MASRSALWKKNMKESDPERFEALKKKEKERSKSRREMKKQELQTRSTSQQAERERLLARERSKRYYDKKTGKSSLRPMNRLSATRPEPTEPALPPAKRPRDMTTEEYREHRRKQRQKSRDAQHSKKKFWVKRKDRDRKKRARAEKKASTVTTPSASVAADHLQSNSSSMTKTQYNFVSDIRKHMAKKAKSPRVFARMVKNLATRTHSPRKRYELQRECLFFQRGTGKAGKTRRRLFVMRKPRKDRVGDETKKKVKLFYMREDISRVLPHKRYALKSGAGYVMQQRLLGAYRIFKQENAHIELSYSMFTKLRPKQVRKISSTYLETCTCVHCINIQWKVLSLNRLSSRLKHPEKRVDNEVGLYKLLLCSRSPEERFHRMACVNGTCSECADRRSTIYNHFNHLPPTQALTWSRWSIVKKEGRKTRQPVARSASVQDCLEELVEDVLHPTKQYSFTQHLHTAHWENNQYRHLKDTLQPSEVLLVQDFAENRKTACQDEIKQAYFGKQQITLHPVVAFYCNKDGQTVRHAVNFISDDTGHDHNAVHHFTVKTLQFFVERGVVQQDTKIYIFSDGCAAQYKGKGTFADLSLYQENIHRVYFGSEHGKGEADGETGVISKAVEAEVLCCKTSITDAASFFSVCKALLKDEPKSKRDFILVAPEDIVRERKETDVKTLQGSRKLHQIVGVRDYVVKGRMLACFCQSCRDENFSMCSNKERVGVFKEHNLTLTRSRCDDVVSHEETDGEVEAETSLDNLTLTQSDDVEVPDEETDREVEAEMSLGFHWDSDHAVEEESVSAPSLDRVAFFETARDELAACPTFVDLQRKANELVGVVALHQFPSENATISGSFPEDPLALELLPPGIRGKFKPHPVYGDGNCFFRSLSLLVFGSENFHAEMRVRVVLAMCTQEHLFLSCQNWLAPCRTPDSVADGEQLLFICRNASSTFGLDSFELSFQGECLTAARNGTYSTWWQLLGAAVALDRPILSVFPPCAYEAYLKHGNRSFRAPGCKSSAKLIVMWSHTRDGLGTSNWEPNHFVPLVHDSKPVRYPKVDATYLAKWGGAVYPCQILETDELLGLVCVRFMSKSRGHWYWNEGDYSEYSWEPIQSLVRQASLSLVESISTQRCQYFQYSAC